MTSMIRKSALVLSLALTTVVVVACSKNPVTGKNELLLVGESWELGVGKQNYSPLRQSQGGDYVVDPSVEAYVRAVGNRLAAVSDRKLPYEFNVINSSVPNAWALPGGKISINRGLLIEMKSEAELAAVLGHEIVHAAAKHGARAQTRGAGLQLAAVGATIGLAPKLGAQAAQMAGSIGAQLINQSYGRKAERESDQYGTLYMSRAGYDPMGAVDLQRTFVKLSKGQQRNKFDQLFSSHPVSENRVRENLKLATALPKGGKVGREEYQRAMRKLMRSKPAYDAYDEANRVYKKDKRKAESLIKKAIRLEPRESMFHSALGDIARERKQYKSARRHYDKAINLHDNFFYYFLRRGEVNRLTRNYAAAKRDLNRSIELLPTADAHAQLGETAMAVNDRKAAVASFRKAASDRSPVGQAAYKRLVRLDLAANPDQYIQTATDISRNGTLAVRLANPTPTRLSNIQFSVTSRVTGQTTRRRVNGVLEPGKARILDTGIQAGPAQLEDLVVRVIAARVIN